jgi:ATP-binding cassette subfamily B protein
MPDAQAGPGWIRRLAGYCWRYRRVSVLTVAGSLLAAIAAAVIPLLYREIVDDVLISHRRSIWPLIAGLAVLALLAFAGQYQRRYGGGQLSLGVQHDLRTELFESLTRLDGTGQDELQTGQIVSRSISDIAIVQRFLDISPMIFGNLVLLAISLVVMVFLSPLLTVTAALVIPALWLIALTGMRRLFPATWYAQQQAGAVAGVVEAAVTGVRVVKGFGQEERELDRLDAVARGLFAARLRVLRLTARYTPLMQAVPMLGQVVVLAFGGWLAIRGSLTLGTFLAFCTYLAQLVAPVRSFGNLMAMAQQARASVHRVFDVIDSRPDVREKPGARRLADGDLAIELDDVEFGYVSSQPVLRGLSMRAEPGETLAVVGASGSGKSTISLLLPRFYDARAGAVRVGGHDVRDLTLTSLREAIGLVMEGSFLFSDTVRANIAYGRPDATDEQVVAAAKAAEADEFIQNLPAGYDTVIGEQGLTLSGGQRQRLALARALITDPRILVLDDATSAVDPTIEAEIRATLRRVMRGRTTLIIAHRRSTLQLASRIAVLDQGRVVDTGTHEELTERCPLYRMLLGGPGQDAEGVDAGELAYYAAAPGTGGVTRDLWDGAAAPGGASGEHGAPAAPPRASGGAPQGPRGNVRLGLISGVAAAPALLKQVERLAPATDTPPRVDQAAARAADPRFTLARLLRPVAVLLLAGLFLDGLDALASLALPALIRGGIDRGVGTKTLHDIVAVSLIALAVVLADWLVNVFQTLLVGRNGERMLYTLRVKTFSHLQRLGLDYYEHEQSGRIMTRMTNDIDALSAFLQTDLIAMVNSVITFLGVLAALLIINIRLGLYVLSVVPVLGIATIIFRRKSSRAYAEAREKVGVVNSDFQENIAGLRVTQAYQREGRNRLNFAGRSDAYRVSRLRAQRYIALYFPFVQLLSTIASAIALGAAAGEVRSGALTVGSAIAYVLYISLLFSPVQQMSQVFDSYQQAVVGVGRVKELLRTPVSTPQPVHPKRVSKLRGGIEFRDVHFSYEPGGPEAISGVDIAIEPGQTIALVGQTGAGKSTLVKLAARYYDVTSGAVLIDGHDVREFDLVSFRRRLGIVPQEAYLFAGTIRDAIAYGRPDASNAEVEAAARAVGAHDMIARLPGGYYHPVAERGRNLSAGQRQLLSLARAQLTDPDILLLDEATSALDLASEGTVVRATERLTARRTTLVIAHRLSTTARADMIAVLADGRIAETGTHEQLLAAGGAYRDLWRSFTADAGFAG